MDGAPEIRIGTSGFSYKEWLAGVYPPQVYVRLRNQSYSERSLRSRAEERLIGFAADGAEVYVYFKHQTAAPGFALRMRELVGEAAPAK